MVMNIKNDHITGEHADVKYIVYKINNIVTNPYKVWIKMNKPVFPSYKQLSKMRSQEVCTNVETTDLFLKNVFNEGI